MFFYPIYPQTYGYLVRIFNTLRCDDEVLLLAAKYVFDIEG